MRVVILKFDRFMEHCFKILCICTAFAIFVGAITSCSSTVYAAEIDYSEQAGIQDFFDAYASNMAAIDFEFNSDADGNRSTRLQVYSLQKLAYTELFQIYDNMDFSAAPSSVSVSGSGTSGLYQSYQDNQIHAMFYTPPPTRSITPPFSIPLYSSDEFSVSLNGISPNWNWSISPYYSQANDRYGVSIYIDMYQGMYANPHYTVSDSMGYFNTFTYNSSGIAYNDSKFMCIGRAQIPTLTANTLVNAMRYNSNDYIGGVGASVALPSGTVDTITPWDYYNDVLLPDIINNYDIDNIEEYLVFPDGYTPTVEPTEPNYEQPGNAHIVPIIIGIPIPIDILDDLGNVLDVLDILADLLPGGGIQFQIDGIDITFPYNDNNVIINGNQYPLPLPDFQIDGHIIDIPDNLHFDFDNVPFVINDDDTVSINNVTYTLPIGTPKILPSEYNNMVYEYQIPTVEDIKIVDSEIPLPNLEQFKDGIEWIFSASYKVFDDSGLFPILMTCLSISAVGYVLYKIGG